LEKWLNSRRRKPLIVRGARQVGKTWLVREMAAQKGLALVELNFERRPELTSLFAGNDPLQICRRIEAALSIELDSHSSLLFLDEIQAAPELIAKLRWFNEELPELAVIAAGSLLEFAISGRSFSMPVGRISFLHLEPMSFFEFLEAGGEQALLRELRATSFDTSLPEALHQKANSRLKQYLLVGGLPALVEQWHDSHDLDSCMELQHDLLATYRDDFHKYTGRLSPALLRETLASVARQLGGKFTYSRVGADLRAASVKSALDLLSRARLVHRVEHSSANGVPLAAEVNPRRFKAILLDCGMLSGMLQLGRLPAARALEFQPVNRGALMEQFVGQHLRLMGEAYREENLYYWQREHGRRGEIDYLLQFGDRVIPIEVKSGASGKMKSLHQFMADKKLKLAVRIHDGRHALEEISLKTTQGQRACFRLLSLPHYAVEQLPDLLSRGAKRGTAR